MTTPTDGMSGASCDLTEKTLYEQPHDDHWGTWQDRLFQCGDGPRKGIGIDVGGTVYVKPMKEWHRLAESEAKWKGLAERLAEAASDIKAPHDTITSFKKDEMGKIYPVDRHDERCQMCALNKALAAYEAEKGK